MVVVFLWLLQANPPKHVHGVEQRTSESPHAVLFFQFQGCTRKPLCSDIYTYIHATHIVEPRGKHLCQRQHDSHTLPWRLRGKERYSVLSGHGRGGLGMSAPRSLDKELPQVLSRWEGDVKCHRMVFFPLLVVCASVLPSLCFTHWNFDFLLSPLYLASRFSPQSLLSRPRFTLRNLLRKLFVPQTDRLFPKQERVPQVPMHRLRIKSQSPNRYQHNRPKPK